MLYVSVKYIKCTVFNYYYGTCSTYFADIQASIIVWINIFVYLLLHMLVSTFHHRCMLVIVYRDLNALNILDVVYCQFHVFTLCNICMKTSCYVDHLFFFNRNKLTCKENKLCIMFIMCFWFVSCYSLYIVIYIVFITIKVYRSTIYYAFLPLVYQILVSI